MITSKHTPDRMHSPLPSFLIPRVLSLLFLLLLPTPPPPPRSPSLLYLCPDHLLAHNLYAATQHLIFFLLFMSSSRLSFSSRHCTASHRNIIPGSSGYEKKEEKKELLLSSCLWFHYSHTRKGLLTFNLDVCTLCYAHAHDRTTFCCIH